MGWTRLLCEEMGGGGCCRHEAGTQSAPWDSTGEMLVGTMESFLEEGDLDLDLEEWIASA